MSRPQMRDNQGSNAMRDATFSRRDMFWAGGALAIGAAFAEPSRAATPEPSGAGPRPTSGGFGDARGDAPDGRDERHPLTRGRAG